MTITDFEAVRDQFLFDIKTIVEMEEVPPGLVFNWDQTGITIFPGSAWTMELKGSRKVEIAGMSDKRQITVVISGTMTGELMPFQVIYQGKTSGCLPHVNFPTDWHATFTPNRWSNEQKMKEYLELIIFPFVRLKHRELDLSAEHPALAIFEVFKGQQTADIRGMLEKENILIVPVPPNCTDRLQPMDLSVNKPVKNSCERSLRSSMQEGC